MYDNRSRLLEQVPLTVSPFISLPTATTLSYNYKPMPSTLPPSILTRPATTTATPPQPHPGDPHSSQQGTPQPTDQKPKYIVSQSGYAAHPDDIIASCRALEEHIERMQKDAERELREFEERIRERDLAEKRRVAPGWLDSDARILEPERKGEDKGKEVEGSSMMGGAGQPPPSGTAGLSEMDTDQGVELDRVFGGLSVK